MTPRRGIGVPRRGFTGRHLARRVSAFLVIAILLSLVNVVSPSSQRSAYAGTVATSANNYSLQLVATPNPAQQGDTITWTVTIKNLRSTTATYKNLITRVGYVTFPGLPCTPTLNLGGGSAWTLRSGTTDYYYLVPGASGTYSCTSTAPAAGSYTYSATPTASASASTAYQPTGFNYWNGASNTDPDAKPQITASETLVVNAPAGPDLAMTKTASATTVTSGNDLTYTLKVDNTGAASGAFTVTDTIPAGLSIKTLPAGCTAAGQTVTCTHTGLAAPGTISYPIVVTAGQTPGVLQNTATVKLSSGAADTNPANDSSTVSVTIQTADLTVSKSATPNPVVAGQPVTFTITVNNAGNAASSTYTLTDDVVPSQFTSVAYSGTPPSGCTVSGNTLTCTGQASLAAGASRTYTLSAVAATAGTFTNTATLSATSNQNTGNDSGSVSVTVQPAESDLTVTKTASPNTGVIAGQTVTYNVAVKNTGNTTSSSYTLTDVVPNGFSTVAVTSVNPASTACTVSGNTATCTNQAGLAPNATRTYTITAVATSTTGGTFTNTATVSATTGEASTANNSGSADVTITASAPDLVVTKAASAATIFTGGQVTWTITVKNDGNQASGPYTLTDVVPNGYTTITAPTTGCTLDQATRTVTCANQASLAPGASKQYTITATAGTTPMATTNTASVGAVPGELVTTNNSGSASVEILATSPYDLVVTKGASPTLVEVGNAVTFTIVVTNNGTSTSPNYTLQDVVPAELSGVSFPFGTTPQPGCAITGNTLNCASQAGLAPGGSRTYVISAVANVAGTVTNSAVVTTTNESNTSNNTGSVSLTIRTVGATLVSTATSNGGAFTLTKAANPTTLPSAGGSVTYTYTVKNNTTSPLYFVSGTDDKCSINAGSATGTTLYDIPGPLGFTRDTWRGIAPGATATWTCTQTISQTTTNTATFQFATSYSYDFWGNPYRTGIQSATVQARVAVSYDPWAACSVTTIWGNTGSWNGSAYIYEYFVDSNGTVTPTGRSIITGSTTTGADIAVSPDNKEMFVLNGAGEINVYDVATGSLLRTLSPNYGVNWGNISGDNKDKANSLSFGPNGNLYVGGFNYNGAGTGTNSLFSVNATTGALTTVWNGGTAEGTGVIPYGYGGDFVTLPDGSLLAAVNVTSGGGIEKFVIFPKQADGSLGAPVNVGYPTYNGSQMSNVYGMTYAQGYLWLAKDDGNWYRISTLPSLSGTASTTYAATQVTEPNVSDFWGATGAQESNTSCTSPSVTIAKDAVSVTGPNASGVYTATYAITVKNTGTTSGTYAPITDMPQFDPVFTPTGATWTGQASGSQTGVGPYQITKIGTPIAAGATHTYNVSITFTWSKAALPTQCVGPGTGLFNSVQANPNRYDDACITPDLPWLNVVKTAGTSSGPDANGVYTVTYTVKVVNTGAGAGTYGPLTDQPLFDPNLTVQGASWTGQATGQAAGAGPFTLAAAGTTIAGNATHTYNVTLTYKKTGTGTVTQCNTSGTGLFNRAVLPGENGTTADNDACVEQPTAPLFAVKKKASTGDWGGTGTAVQVAADGTATVTYVVEVSNTGTVAGFAPQVADQITAPTGFTVTSVAVSRAGTPLSPQPAVANGAFTIPAATTTLAAGASTTYEVQVVFTMSSLTAVDWTKAATCTTTNAGTPTDGGLFNTVTMTGDSDGNSNNDACVPVLPPKQPITIEKLGTNCDVGVTTCPLPGATFVIYDAAPNGSPAPTPIINAFTANAATTVFTSVALDLYKDYWLVETNAPNGYSLLATPVKFQITPQGIVLAPNQSLGASAVVKTGSGFTLQVLDTRQGTLPVSGGSGHLPYLAIGLLIALGAAWRRTQVSVQASPRRAL